jgi:hypothetical protein
MIRLRACAFALALLGFPLAALGQENKDNDNTNVGVGIVCDTAGQVERYISLNKDGTPAEAAIQTINTESNNPHACGMVVAAFVVGEEVGNVTVPDGTVRIVEITIVAAQTQSGWQRTPPTVQYTGVFVKSEAA